MACETCTIDSCGATIDRSGAGATLIMGRGKLGSQDLVADEEFDVGKSQGYAGPRNEGEWCIEMY